MKFVFAREELSRVMDVAERVLPKKSALPFYQALYVGVVEGGVEFRVTNGDQFLAVEIPAVVEGAGIGEGVALPGEEFLRLVKVAPSSEVVVTTSSDRAQVMSGGAEWILRYLTGVEWSDAPQALDDEPTEWSPVDPVSLQAALRKVSYAVSRTQNRPSFQQVFVGGGRAVAADGRRAHVVSGLGLERGEYLIPEAVLDIVLLLLAMSEDQGEVVIDTSGDWVRILSGRLTFTTGRLAYDFPDVQGRMLADAAAQTGRLTVARQALVTAVLVASTAEDEGKVLLSVDGGRIRVESESSQMKAHMDFEIESEGMNGKWSRWFTSELLAEMLGAVEGEFVEFRVSPDGQGMLYVEVENECSVLMPLST